MLRWVAQSVDTAMLQKVGDQVVFLNIHASADSIVHQDTYLLHQAYCSFESKFIACSKHIALPIHMELLVNNKKYSVQTEADENLLNVLRNHLDLTGSKYGCGEGACGACTVLINGAPVRSCITPAQSVEGKPITTIEGLQKNGQLHPVQNAFLEVDVFQCAYCASGMIMAAVSLLDKNPKPTEQDIIKSMQGNICRCGTYTRIVEAIKKAASV